MENLEGYIILSMFMGLLMFIVYMWYRSKSLKYTNASTIAKDAEYRKLSENFARLQQELKAGQVKMLAEQSQINNRVTTIEKMLKEVD